MKYHKIETIFERDASFKCIPAFRDPTVAALRDLDWVWTEKLDGMNIRILWDGEAVKFAGRTDNATLHPDLLVLLQRKFTSEALRSVFGTDEAVLFGEGIGAKIQRGGDYCDGFGFVLFDIWSNVWYSRGAIFDLAEDPFGIDAAPIIDVCGIDAAVSLVRDGFPSQYALRPRPAEGLVGRPPAELFDNRGRRVIVKLKTKDF